MGSAVTTINQRAQQRPRIDHPACALTHLVMRGASLKAVQELLGHATIQMTERYAHLSPNVRRETVQLLNHATWAQHETSGQKKAPGVPGLS
jgi:integrase